MSKARMNQMHKDIGRVEGKVDSLCDEVAGIGKILAGLAKNEARVDAAYDQLDAHDKRISDHGRRIGEIERKCGERGVRIKGVEEHAKGDKPVEQWVNEKAAKALWAILGGAILLAAQKLPAIVGFLFSP